MFTDAFEKTGFAVGLEFEAMKTLQLQSAVQVVGGHFDVVGTYAGQNFQATFHLNDLLDGTPDADEQTQRFVLLSMLRHIAIDSGVATISQLSAAVAGKAWRI